MKILLYINSIYNVMKYEKGIFKEADMPPHPPDLPPQTHPIIAFPTQSIFHSVSPSNSRTIRPIIRAIKRIKKGGAVHNAPHNIC